MTTIAYRNGIIAADTGAVIGGARVGHMSKIARNKKGDLAGAAGNAGYAYVFLEWFQKGEKGKPPIGETGSDVVDRGIIIRTNYTGIIEVYEKDQMFKIHAQYYAMGSGRCEAIGAMYAGAGAEEAVYAAMTYDVCTFGSLEVLKADKS